MHIQPRTKRGKREHTTTILLSFEQIKKYTRATLEKKEADRVSRQASPFVFFYFVFFIPNDPSESPAPSVMAVVWHRFRFHRGRAVETTAQPRNIDEWYCNKRCQQKGVARVDNPTPKDAREEGSTAGWTERSLSPRVEECRPKTRREDRATGERRESLKCTRVLSRSAP